MRQCVVKVTRSRFAWWAVRVCDDGTDDVRGPYLTERRARRGAWGLFGLR